MEQMLEEQERFLRSGEASAARCVRVSSNGGGGGHNTTRPLQKADRDVVQLGSGLLKKAGATGGSGGRRERERSLFSARRRTDGRGNNVGVKPLLQPPLGGGQQRASHTAAHARVSHGRGFTEEEEDAASSPSSGGGGGGGGGMFPGERVQMSLDMEDEMRAQVDEHERAHPLDDPASLLQSPAFLASAVQERETLGGLGTASRKSASRRKFLENSSSVNGFPCSEHRSKGGLVFARSSTVTRGSGGGGKLTTNNSEGSSDDDNKSVPGPFFNVRPTTAERQPPSTLEEEIHEENAHKVGAMSAEEIAEAQREIMSAMDPELVAALRKRGREKTDRHKNRTAAAAAAAAPVATAAAHEDKKASPIDLCEITTEEELQRAVDESLPLSEREKLEWTRLPTTTEASCSDDAREVGPRVDLSGEVIVDSASPAIAFDKSLYHHGGDSNAPGYTTRDLCLLARSANSPQRIIALRALGGLLRRRAAALASGNAPSHGSLPDVIPVILRSALDASNMTVVSAGISALEAWLVDLNDERAREGEAERRYRGQEALPHLARTQPTLGVRAGSEALPPPPSIAQQRLEGERWPQFNAEALASREDFVKVTDSLESRGGKEGGGEAVMSVCEEEGEDYIRDAAVCRADPVRGLLTRMTLLQRLRHLLRVEVAARRQQKKQGRQWLLSDADLCSILRILTYCARHSPEAALCVARSRGLLAAVRALALEPTGDALVSLLSPTAARATTDGGSDPACMSDCLSLCGVRLLRALCQGSRSVAVLLEQWTHLETVKGFLALTGTGTGTADGALSPLESVQVEVLKRWRVCLGYGLDVESTVSLLALVPTLQHGSPPLDSSSANPQQQQHPRLREAAFRVLEATAYCSAEMSIDSGNVSTSSIDGDYILMLRDISVAWGEHLTTVAWSVARGGWSGGDDDDSAERESDVPLSASVLHFLAAYFDRTSKSPNSAQAFYTAAFAPSPMDGNGQGARNVGGTTGSGAAVRELVADLGRLLRELLAPLLMSRRFTAACARLSGGDDVRSSATTSHLVDWVLGVIRLAVSVTSWLPEQLIPQLVAACASCAGADGDLLPSLLHVLDCASGYATTDDSTATSGSIADSQYGANPIGTARLARHRALTTLQDFTCRLAVSICSTLANGDEDGDDNRRVATLRRLHSHALRTMGCMLAGDEASALRLLCTVCLSPPLLLATLPSADSDDTEQTQRLQRRKTALLEACVTLEPVFRSGICGGTVRLFDDEAPELARRAEEGDDPHASSESPYVLRRQRCGHSLALALPQPSRTMTLHSVRQFHVMAMKEGAETGSRKKKRRRVRNYVPPALPLPPYWLLLPFASQGDPVTALPVVRGMLTLVEETDGVAADGESHSSFYLRRYLAPPRPRSSAWLCAHVQLFYLLNVCLYDSAVLFDDAVTALYERRLATVVAAAADVPPHPSRFDEEGRGQEDTEGGTTRALLMATARWQAPTRGLEIAAAASDPRAASTVATLLGEDSPLKRLRDFVGDLCSAFLENSYGYAPFARSLRYFLRTCFPPPLRCDVWREVGVQAGLMTLLEPQDGDDDGGMANGAAAAERYNMPPDSNVALLETYVDALAVVKGGGGGARALSRETSPTLYCAAVHHIACFVFASSGTMSPPGDATWPSGYFAWTRSLEIDGAPSSSSPASTERRVLLRKVLLQCPASVVGDVFRYACDVSGVPLAEGCDRPTLQQRVAHGTEVIRQARERGGDSTVDENAAGSIADQLAAMTND